MYVLYICKYLLSLVKIFRYKYKKIKASEYLCYIVIALVIKDKYPEMACISLFPNNSSLYCTKKSIKTYPVFCHNFVPA